MADKPKGGSTSYSHTIKLFALADGAPVTGKVAADLTATYRRPGATRQTITLSDLAALTSAYSSGGVKEDADGEYRIDLPDAMMAAAVDYVSLHVTCAGAYVYSERIPLPTQLPIDVYTLLASVISSGKVLANVSTAGDFAQAAADKVWASSTRTVTSFAGVATDVATAVWASVSRSLTTVGNIVSGVLDEPIAGHTTTGSVGEKISTAASAGDPWDTLIPGSYTTGKAGKVVGDALDAAVSTRAAASALTTLQGDVTTLGTTTGAVKTKTDQLTFTSNKVAAQILLAGDFAQGAADKVWSTASRTLTGFGTLVADVAAGVWAASVRTLSAFGFTFASAWDESATAHNTAGTMGAKLNAAASAGDPWTTLIPGDYTAGEAGYVLGNLDTNTTEIAAIKAKTDQLTFTEPNVVDAAGQAVLDPTQAAELAAIKAKTDQLVFTTPNVLDAAATNLTTGALANAILRTALTESYAADGAPFTLEQAVYMLWAAAAAEKVISGSTMTVKKLDGTTTAMTFTLNDPSNPTAITRAS